MRFAEIVVPLAVWFALVVWRVHVEAGDVGGLTERQALILRYAHAMRELTRIIGESLVEVLEQVTRSLEQWRDAMAQGPPF